MTKIRTTPLFSRVYLCSATSMESFRRDLLHDVAEHEYILETDQNTYSTAPVLVSYPKKVQHSLKWVFCYCGRR